MKIINLLNRVIGNHGRRLKKSNEYMFWSPFISHHKPKLQINTQTQKWKTTPGGDFGSMLVSDTFLRFLPSLTVDKGG